MNAPSPDEIAEAERWLREAGEELDVARLLAGHEEVPARAACFHAHLCAEKALKALAIRRGVTVPPIHDLVELAELLSPSDRSRFEPDDLDSLNPWTIEGRYPANLFDVASERVRGLVTAAERVMSAAHAAFAKAEDNR